MKKTKQFIVTISDHGYSLYSIDAKLTAYVRYVLLTF